MRHFPIYLDLHKAAVVVSGVGETAVAKLRLLLKTTANIRVFGRNPAPTVRGWADEQRIVLVERRIEDGDADGARLLYAANDDAAEDARAAAIGRAGGALVNIVDNLDDSEFITPAIIDRDPVTIAIGTEGAAPVLARQVKARFEAQLDNHLGTLARIGREFRQAASALPRGAPVRAFWSEYYEHVGPAALATGGDVEVRAVLAQLLAKHLTEAARATPSGETGYVWLIGAGPGDPDLLTNKARRAMHDADVVVHDRLVSPEILELARREAIFVEVGKAPGGDSWRQEDINQLMISHASEGRRVARLKSGDPTIYGRLDEEMDALDAAGIAFEIVPGITTALAAAARAKVSLTQRGRNSDLRILTGQDINGFAEHDWHGLARPGAVAAIYMGMRSARFLQGRLLMHGADPATPMTIVENISRHDEAAVATTLGGLEASIRNAGLRGPAIILFGLSPRHATSARWAAPSPHALEVSNMVGASQ